MLRKFPLYPILFSIFPVLSLAGYNIDEISLDVIWRPLLISLLIGTVLFGFARLIFRDWERAALAVAIILFLFFIYGQVYSVLEDVTFGDMSLFRHRNLLPLFGLLLLAALFIVVYWKMLHSGICRFSDIGPCCPCSGCCCLPHWFLLPDGRIDQLHLPIG
jgi:hypothetical protein